MARLRPLQVGQLESIARQVGGLLGGRDEGGGNATKTFGAGGTALEVLESFPLVTLSQAEAEAALKAKRDLAEVVRPTGVWHHQVRGKNNYVGFARAELKGPPATAKPRVLEYASSSEAAILDSAIQIADRAGVSDDLEAYLLDSVELGAAALLLVDSGHKESLAVIIRGPRNASDDVGSAEKLQISSSRNFLRWYASLREIRGVQFPKDDYLTRSPS